MNINDKGQWVFAGGINPICHSLNGFGIYAPHAETLRDSITVKTGRKAILRLCHLAVVMSDLVAGQSFVTIFIKIRKKGQSEITCYGMQTGSVINFESRNVSADLLIPLDSGDIVSVYTQNFAIGGAVQFEHFLNLIEFDF